MRDAECSPGHPLGRYTKLAQRASTLAFARPHSIACAAGPGSDVQCLLRIGGVMPLDNAFVHRVVVWIDLADLDWAALFLCGIRWSWTRRARWCFCNSFCDRGNCRFSSYNLLHRSLRLAGRSQPEWCTHRPKLRTGRLWRGRSGSGLVSRPASDC